MTDPTDLPADTFELTELGYARLQLLRAREDVGAAWKIIDSQDQVGGWPTMAAGTASADADADGMPDAWEKARGLNSGDAADAAKDRNGDGYTNIEEYINEFFLPSGSTVIGNRGSYRPASTKRAVLMNGNGDLLFDIRGRIHVTAGQGRRNAGVLQGVMFYRQKQGSLKVIFGNRSSTR